MLWLTTKKKFFQPHSLVIPSVYASHNNAKSRANNEWRDFEGKLTIFHLHISLFH